MVGWGGGVETTVGKGGGGGEDGAGGGGRIIKKGTETLPEVHKDTARNRHESQSYPHAYRTTSLCTYLDTKTT